MLFWKRYLILTSICLILMGAYIVIFKNTIIFHFFSQLIDPVFWPNEIVSKGTENFKGFIYSFSGIYVLLWGINSYFLVKYALLPKNTWAWNCLMISIIIWFIVMFPFSIYYKVYYNAASDVAFLIILLIPMVKLRKYIFVSD